MSGVTKTTSLITQAHKKIKNDTLSNTQICRIASTLSTPASSSPPAAFFIPGIFGSKNDFDWLIVVGICKTDNKETQSSSLLLASHHHASLHPPHTSQNHRQFLSILTHFAHTHTHTGRTNKHPHTSQAMELSINSPLGPAQESVRTPTGAGKYIHSVLACLHMNA